MENEEIILNPDPARIMEGLRDTGYDFNTAMADLVDNSIAANATVIDVRINLNPSNEITVYIADNGCGMDFNGLKNAMTYGSAKREDPSSLGKFGLGLKTASTAFCRSLSLISKTEDSEYHKVRWDLDHVVNVKKWQLLQLEIDEEEIELLESVTDGGSGTLVVWEKVDRLMKSYAHSSSLVKAHKRIVDSLKQHFAMVYQRFLDPEFSENPVTIFVNDERVDPWDPFCRNESKREVLAERDQQIELEDGERKSFHICAVLLPRVEDWSSPEAHTNARISNDNEGFYIYRENRLIYHGDWLGIFVNDPHISLLRVEFSFDHTLDDLFNVDIKKSRIILNEDIYDYLKNNFLPAPRKRANDLYRAAQSKKVADNIGDSHQKSNKTIESNAKSLENSKIDVVDKNNGIVKIHNKNGSSTGTLRIIDIDKNQDRRVITEQKGNDTFLWESGIVDQVHAVLINTDHPFYSKVYAKIENGDVIAGIDYLLWALSEAELSTYSDEVAEQYEDMRYQVSKTLKKLVNTLPDPEYEEEE